MGNKLNYLWATSAPRVSSLAMARWCPIWPALLILALLVPTGFSFMLGSLRLTPYRLVLIAAFIPLMLRLASGRAGKVTVVDSLLITHIIWSYIVIGYHHGFSQSIESGGIRMLELYGAFLVARATILNERDYRGVTAFLFFAVCLLAPFVIFETLTGVHLIQKISVTLTGVGFLGGMDSRMGLHRAYGPFDHPIHLGVFAAGLIGIWAYRAIPRLGRPKIRKYPFYAIVASTISSVSSGALAAMITQFVLIIWRYLARRNRNRWMLFTFLLIASYMVVDIISNRSGIKVFLHYLTFSAATAYNRIIIFDNGIQDVYRNPFMGIGFNLWSKPVWMHSDSLDNFWLFQAITYGVPGFLTLLLPVLLLLGRNWKDQRGRVQKLRLGWNISVIGLIISACTVHFWNSLFVYFAFFLGMGHWFICTRNNSKNGSVDNDKFQ